MGNTQEQITLVEILRPIIKLLTHFIGKDGREWLNAFNRFLRKEGVWLIQYNWKVWRFARVGMKKSLSELIKFMPLHGYQFRPDTGFPNFKLYTASRLHEIGLNFNIEEEDVYFTTVSPRKLGLKESFSVRELLEAASKRGLDLCLSGDLFELIAQGYCSLSRNESFRFLTKVTLESESDYLSLLIEYEDGKQMLSFKRKKLDENHGYIITYLDTEHVFRIRKRIALAIRNS